MDTKIELGQLEQVDLRAVWESEPYSFTPWLAQQSNLDRLAEVLELPELDLVQIEKSVSEFSVDIVAKMRDTGDIVAIENQLELSDHTHLGQSLTYAAGTGAKAVIWVCKRFKEGHLAALEWLNRVTDDEIGFFGVEIEAWKIGNSLPAPKFNVVVRPNVWARNVRERATSITPVQAQNIEYWRAFNVLAAEYDWPRSSRTTQGDSIWQQFANTDDLSVWLHCQILRGETRKVSVGIQVNPVDRSRADLIASTLIALLPGAPGLQGLSFTVSAERGGKVNARTFADFDPDDSASWESQHRWIAATSKRLRDAFTETVRSALVVGQSESQEQESSV